MNRVGITIHSASFLAYTLLRVRKYVCGQSRNTAGEVPTFCIFKHKCFLIQSNTNKLLPTSQVFVSESNRFRKLVYYCIVRHPKIYFHRAGAHTCCCLSELELEFI